MQQAPFTFTATVLASADFLSHQQWRKEICSCSRVVLFQTSHPDRPARSDGPLSPSNGATNANLSRSSTHSSYRAPPFAAIRQPPKLSPPTSKSTRFSRPEQHPHGVPEQMRLRSDEALAESSCSSLTRSLSSRPSSRSRSSPPRHRHESFKKKASTPAPFCFGI